MSDLRRLPLIILAALAATPCHAETGAAPDQEVTQATAVESPPPATGQRVHFKQLAAAAGDRVVQRVGVDLELTTKIVQSGQVAHEGVARMRRQQQRTIDVLEAADGRAVKSRVKFEVSRRQSPDNADPEELAVQPIEGKVYLATRQDDRLRVTDPDGIMPPQEEYLLVMESLDSVGKPNPMAALLAGRSVEVGEHLHVPRELARTLLNMNDPVGSVRRFELTLDRVTDARGDEPSLAVFQARIELTPDDKSPLAVTLAGEMGVDPASSRLMAIDLAGPVGISTIERTSGGIYQYSAAGQLQMAMRARYGRSGE